MAERATSFWDAAGGISFLAPLSETDRRVVGDAARLRAVREGEVLLGPGVTSESLYLVERGMLGVAISPADGGTIELNRLGRGDYCGELSLVRHEHSGAVVRALQPSEVWEIPHAVLSEVAERSPALTQELLRILAARLGDTNRRLRELRTEGQVVLWATSVDPLWSGALTARVSERVARLSGRPVAVLDLTGSVAGALGAHSAASRAEVVARATVPHPVARCSPPADAAAALEELRFLRARFPLVIVHARHDDPALGMLTVESRSLTWIGEAHAGPRPGGAREAILLRTSPDPPTEGERALLGRGLGVEVLRVVAADLRALEVNHAGSEAERSAGWIARHLLGRKVGLALGAGGVKGYAHLGVLEELRAVGLEVDYVAGTSIGAPLATASVLGMAPHEVREHMDALFAGLGQFRLPWRSIWTSDRLRVAFERLCAGRVFEDLTRPLAIVAADLGRREEYVFSRGSVSDAIVASLSIPAIFPPVLHEGRLLVDGAVLNPVPVSTLRAAGADIIVGVTLTPPPSGEMTVRRGLSLLRPPVVDTVMRAFDLMQWKITTEGAARADVSIEPTFHGPTGLRDYRRGDEYIEAGRVAASAAADRLRAIASGPDLAERLAA